MARQHKQERDEVIFNQGAAHNIMVFVRDGMVVLWYQCA